MYGRTNNPQPQSDLPVSWVPGLARNICAFQTRLRLQNGEADAAAEWLKNREIPLFSGLSFCDAYLHFTTARALFAVGETDWAILLLSKLRGQAVRCNCPFGMIEADMLIAACYGADKMLEQALEALAAFLLNAQQYGLTEPFIHESPAICDILNELSLCIMQAGCAHPICPDFLRTLCRQTGKKPGGHRAPRRCEKQPTVKLPNKQIMIAEFLARGYSYQNIADTMGLKLSTTKSYMRELYNKLGVFHVEEALDRLYELGILKGSL